MNLQYLEYIMCVEQCGSISAAAEKLFISQPYLSRIVREMEEEYQITLFTRGKHGITLTDRGHIFIGMTRSLLENVNQFNNMFRNNLDDCMHLRIATTPSSLVMDAYIRMLKNMSDSSLRFYYKEEHNYDVIYDVYTSAADIGIIAITDNDRDMVKNFLKVKRIAWKPIRKMGFRLILGTNHPLLKKESPITIEDIYQYNFVMYAPKSNIGIRNIENIYNQTSMETLLNWDAIQQIHYVYSRSCLHNLITEANCIALGSEEVLDQTDQFHIVSVPFPCIKHGEAPVFNSHFWYIYLKDRGLSPLARRFAEDLEEYYGEDDAEEL